MTVYRRPDPIPLRRPSPIADVNLHAVRSEQEDLHRLVSRQIFGAIVSGVYPEGTILPNEEALRSKMAVSRTALREAVKGLVAKGILETRRSRGTLVLSRSAWNMFDPDVIQWLSREDSSDVATQLLATLRIAILGAAELAAEHRSGDGLARTALVAGDARFEARVDFLLALGTASHNRFVASLISSSARGLMDSNRRRFEGWLAWLTPAAALTLADYIHRAEPALHDLLNQQIAAEPERVSLLF